MTKETLIRSHLGRLEKQLREKLKFLDKALAKGWNAAAVDALMDAADLTGQVEALVYALGNQPALGSKGEFKRYDALWDRMNTLRSKQTPDETVGGGNAPGGRKGLQAVLKYAKKAKKARSPKRWSVRCKTGDGNWRSVASELTKGEAAREAKIYERKGYESCVFEGRRKAK